MLEGAGEQEAKQRASGEFQQHQQEAQLKTPSKVKHRSGSASPAGVHSLALLLMDLQPGADGPQVLAADALYRLGRTEEAYRLLLSVGPAGPRAPILARLALLQLHRGFLYNTNQLLKKLIHCGDTSCLIPLLAVAQQRDRALLQTHCHSAAKRILEASGDEGALREAVTYLSIAIMASGGEAVDSLLERARCYASLGQRKTAIFDFSAILKDHPQHVQALCGRSFTYLMLSQQQECTRDLLAALQVNADVVAKDILALKAGARKLVCDWLHQFCRGSLSDALASASVPCQEEQLRQAFVTCAALMRIDCREPRWHLLHVDILLAKGEDKAAGAHLRQVFGQEPRDAAAQARVGVVEAAQHNYGAAARRLGRLAEKDPSSLETLLTLIPPSQRRAVALLYPNRQQHRRPAVCPQLLRGLGLFLSLRLPFRQRTATDSSTSASGQRAWLRWVHTSWPWPTWTRLFRATGNHLRPARRNWESGWRTCASAAAAWCFVPESLQLWRTSAELWRPTRTGPSSA
eukprot:XP_011600673.1 PREDICTED: tetratricopeptide repeat protein 34 isoform X2 [Takifugu rubripes]